MFTTKISLKVTMLTLNSCRTKLNNTVHSSCSLQKSMLLHVDVVCKSTEIIQNVTVVVVFNNV